MLHSKLVPQLSLVLALVLLTAKITPTQAAENISDGRLKVFILAGQSNMVGVGLDTLILARATQKLAQSYVPKKEARS